MIFRVAVLLLVSSCSGEQSLATLMARTRQARDSLAAQSLAIEGELKSVMTKANDKPQAASFLESAAESKVQSESRLQHDAQLLRQRKARYEMALAQLHADADRLRS
jgi:hypothetical protein